MTKIIRRATYGRLAAATEREHPIPDRRDSLHDGEQINTRTEQLGFLSLDADTDDGRANDLARIVKSAELISECQRWRIGGTQVADGLCHPVIAGIGQRRKHDRRRVRKKADNAQQPKLLYQ